MADRLPLSAPARLYSVHPAVAYSQAILENLPEKTGRSLAEWVELLRRDGPAGFKQQREWLKKAHGLGGTRAHLIVDRAAGRCPEDTEPEAYLRCACRWVEALYEGSRAPLRPIHDALVDLALDLGGDVRICPCKTIVPLYRQHVFAQIKPTTRTRIDLGLALKKADVPEGGRLLSTGGAGRGDRITHRIPLASVEEIDDEVRRWTSRAYSLDA